MPRIARIVAIDYPHHVVQRGNRKEPVFFDDEDRCNYLFMLKKSCQEFDCSVHAYCLMNNHVHLLVIPHQEKSLSKTMHKLSFQYAQYINKKYEKSGRLWESRYHSSVIDRNSYLWMVCKYIESNPVRAQIVAEPFDYQWSSAKINAGIVTDGFLKTICTDSDREQYSSFLKREEEIEQTQMINRATFCGRPIGTETFMSALAAKCGLKSIVAAKPRGRPRKK